MILGAFLDVLRNESGDCLTTFVFPVYRAKHTVGREEGGETFGTVFIQCEVEPRK